MKWAIYFCDYEDMDYDGPSRNAEQTSIVEADTKDAAIKRFQEDFICVRIIDVILIRNQGELI